MKVRFYGVRGSTPAADQRMARYGGNTACVEVRLGDEILILDAGTGIRGLGANLIEEFRGRGIDATLLISHTHWDHIQGVPFFMPAYSPKNRIQVIAARGSRERLGRALSNQTDAIHFPIGLERMVGLLPVQELESDRVELGSFRVSVTELNHPGGCSGFRVEAGGASVAYLPDHEPYDEVPQNAARAQAIIDFVRGADLLILDTQYTDAEYPQRVGWGHGRLSHSIAVALAAGVREIALFHLDPAATDDDVDQMVQEGRALARGTPLLVRGATENSEIVLRGAPAVIKVSERHEPCIGQAMLGAAENRPLEMIEPPNPQSSHADGSPATASELNNLLEIIAGTSSLIENVWDGNDGSEKYFNMLRASIDRAADIAAELVAHAGGSDTKVLLHPELAAFARRRKAPEPRQPLKRCILAVDDEPMNLVLAKRILSPAGFEVITAQSGFECLDQYRKSPGKFDLVLLDLSMPFMDGEETFERLKNISPNVVVLLSTGFIEQERLDRMLGAGMSGFLRKPHRPAELVAHVNAVLQSVNLKRVGCAVTAAVR